MEQSLVLDLNKNVMTLTEKMGAMSEKMDEGMRRLDAVSERLDNFDPCERCPTVADMEEIKPIVKDLNERRIGSDARRNMAAFLSGAIGVVLGWLAQMGIDLSGIFRPSP